MLTNTPLHRTGRATLRAAGRSAAGRGESASVDTPATQIELVRPWRTATFVAAGVAAVELVLLVVPAVALLGRSLAPHIHAAAAQAAAPRRSTRRGSRAGEATRSRDRPPHAARDPAPLEDRRPDPERQRGQRRGRPGGGGSSAPAATASADTKNAPRSGYPTWRLMAAPGYAAEAKRFARDIDLRPRRVGPLDGMTPKQLHGAKLVLILGVSR